VSWYDNDPFVHVWYNGAVESAGGTALVGPDAEHPSPVPLLDLPITKLEYKCGVGYGSKAEMDLFVKFLF